MKISLLLSNVFKVAKQPSTFPSFCSRLMSTVKINYEEISGSSSRKDLSPVIIAHGMLGSLANWTSISKNLSRQTERRIVTFDARNHGNSDHVDKMSYDDMSTDLVNLMSTRLKMESAVLVGHSMGGRTAMYTALSNPELVDKLVVVDISPVNKKFDVTDATEWNMSHFFHSLKSVKFPEKAPISQARREADAQLSVRIKDPGIRAWLLMNLVEDQEGKVRWRVNLDAIQRAFQTDICNFPYDQFEESGTKFNKPTLFIGGGDSEYIPVHDHPAIEELFPQAKFVYVPGAGHWVHSQKPYEFLDILVKFLNE